MGPLRKTGAALRRGFEQQFQTVSAVGLFVGLACNLAFVGQVYFWPAMWHTSALMVSYTDAAYGAELLTAVLLLFRLRRRGSLPGPRALGVLALLVQVTLVLYCVIFGLGFQSPAVMDWVCGAIFGIYLPLSMVSWLRAHAGLPPSAVVWNIMLAAAFASFVIWVFTGLAGVKICVCMGVLLLIATLVLSRRLRDLGNSPVADPEGGAPSPSTVPFRYPVSAVFLFSLAFIIAISFAGKGGADASFAAGAFLAPLLLVCAIVLLVNVAAFPLTNIAVPAIVMATITASSLQVDPALSFDLAALGMFLFLAYAVVLLCAATPRDDRAGALAFLRLMVAFAAGCIVGRCVMAACSLIDGFTSDALVLAAVLVANGAAVILMRRGATPRRSEELFGTGDEGCPDGDPGASYRDAVDAMAAARNLGEREKEVLVLLLQRKSASAVAAELVIANGTAKSHIRHVYKKLDVHSRAELFALFGIDADGGR